ncbi:MAG: glycosyltransferase family 39 protein [Phycisphaerae bacterium]
MFKIKKEAAVPAIAQRAIRTDWSWMVLSGLSVGLFIVWLAAGGYRWDGYPCFIWNAGLVVRSLYLLVLLGTVIYFCHLLLKIAVGTESLSSGSAIASFVSFILLRIILSSAIPLVNDEAYHWLWPAKIDWCYYDHGGMLAWVVYPFRCISKSVLAARMGPIIMGTVTVLLLWRFSRWLTGDPKIADRCLAGMMILPAGLIGTTLLLTDTPLAVLWIAGLWTTMLGIRRQGLGWWILAGMCWGFGLDCKFLGIPLMGMSCLYLLIDPKGRAALKTFGPYLAVLVAGVAFLPTILWNAEHGWQTFIFHFVSREPIKGVYPMGFLNYCGYQFFLIGPVFLIWSLFGPLPWGWREFRKGNYQAVLLILTVYCPFILYVGLHAFRPPEVGGMNWTVPLLGLLVLILVWSAGQSPSAKYWLKGSLVAGSITTCLLVIVLMGQVFLGPEAVYAIARPWTTEHRINSKLVMFFGSMPMGREIDVLYPRYSRKHKVFVMARQYRHAAELTEYSSVVPLVLNYGNDSIYGQCFRYWNQPQSHQGEDCLFVSDHPLSRNHLNVLKRSFQSVELLGPSERAPWNRIGALHCVYYCRNLIHFPQGADAQQ